MNPSFDDCKKWQGRTVDGKFPLRQWLGSSDHSAIFLTTLGGSQKAAIKIVAENADADVQLARWADASRLSHPHLIRLLAHGRCQIDDRHLLYVVLEHAEEDLAQILPQRPLSLEETTQMLLPAAEALAYLHQTGFAHGRLKPANIMAVDNQLKISSDSIGRPGAKDRYRASTEYDAPELASLGRSPAADMWSVGATIVAVLTQHPPDFDRTKPADPMIPRTVPEPLYGIAKRCLRADANDRANIQDVLSALRPAAPVPVTTDKGRQTPARRPKAGIIAAIAVAILAAVFVGRGLIARQPRVPAPAASAEGSSPSSPLKEKPSPAPFSETTHNRPTAGNGGAVLEQVMPPVPPSARNTITGKIKVAVRVDVDETGKVDAAKVVVPGSSQYFRKLALDAARKWKFTPPQKNGQPVPSQWTLHFQFSRNGTQALPAETR